MFCTDQLFEIGKMFFLLALDVQSYWVASGSLAGSLVGCCPAGLTVSTELAVKSCKVFSLSGKIGNLLD